MIEVGPPSYNRLTYDEAVLYCQFLEHNGHTDWRLPTGAEYYTQYWDSSVIWYQGRCNPIWPQCFVQPVRDI